MTKYLNVALRNTKLFIHTQLNGLKMNKILDI